MGLETDRIICKSVTIGVVFQDTDAVVERLATSLSKIDLSNCSEIVVVDNASKNEQAINFFDTIANVKIIKIRNSVRMPLAFNRNQAFRHGTGDILLFIDSDVEFIQEDFLNVGIDNFNRYNCDLCSPVILGHDGNIQSFGVEKIAGLPYILKAVKEIRAKVTEVDMIFGACFLCRRSVMERIGGFDEYMAPFNFEEADFAIRAKLYGYDIIATSNIKILHYGKSTSGKFDPRYRAYLLISHALRSIRRNYSGLRRITISLLFLFGAQARMLVEFKTYFGGFVIPKAVIFLMNDINPEQIYID